MQYTYAIMRTAPTGCHLSGKSQISHKISNWISEITHLILWRRNVVELFWYQMCLSNKWTPTPIKSQKKKKPVFESEYTVILRGSYSHKASGGLLPSDFLHTFSSFMRLWQTGSDRGRKAHLPQWLHFEMCYFLPTVPPRQIFFYLVKKNL
jgi:hypothetical protein